MALRGQQQKAPPAPVSRPFCSTVGCEQRVTNGANGGKCNACALREHQERADARCRELGLDTPEKRRDYFHRQLKRVRVDLQKPTFERWCDAMTQHSVDMMVRLDWDESLEKLRRACVIDAENKLIPLEQRAAMLEEKKKERERFEAELKARVQVQPEEAHG